MSTFSSQDLEKIHREIFQSPIFSENVNTVGFGPMYTLKWTEKIFSLSEKEFVIAEPPNSQSKREPKVNKIIDISGITVKRIICRELRTGLNLKTSMRCEIATTSHKLVKILEAVSMLVLRMNYQVFVEQITWSWQNCGWWFSESNQDMKHFLLCVHRHKNTNPGFFETLPPEIIKEIGKYISGLPIFARVYATKSSQLFVMGEIADLHDVALQRICEGEMILKKSKSDVD